MAGFLYFVSGIKAGAKLGDEPLRTLSYAFESQGNMHASPVLDGKGPDGASGCIVAYPKHVPRIGYYPDAQTWRKLPGFPGIWIGVYRDDMPTPKQLERATLVNGNAVELGAGAFIVPAMWRVDPDGEQLDRRETCPTSYDLDDDGKWKLGQRRPPFDRLWSHAELYFDLVLRVAGTAERMTANYDGPPLVAMMIDCLAVNYLVTAIEAVVLGICDDVSAKRVLDALIDRQNVEAWAEKKTLALNLSAPDG